MAVGRELKAWIARGGIAALLVCGASGCVSYSYVDANNVQHVVGLVDVSLPAATAAGRPQATSVTLTTVGLALYRNPQSNSGITLGYNKETITSLPSGACIDLNAGGVCAGSQFHNSIP